MAENDEILNTLVQVAAIAEVCIERKLLLPALILVYSGIDTMSWLVSSEPATAVKKRFTAWVDRFMLPAKPLPCSSIDLYAARCGILHSFTADSDLSVSGHAKPIYYAWGSVSKEHYDRVAAVAPEGGFAFLRVEDLSEAFRRGIAKTIEAGTTDSQLAATIMSKSGRFFSFIPSTVLFAGDSGANGAT